MADRSPNSNDSSKSDGSSGDENMLDDEGVGFDQCEMEEPPRLQSNDERAIDLSRPIVRRAMDLSFGSKEKTNHRNENAFGSGDGKPGGESDDNSMDVDDDPYKPEGTLTLQIDHFSDFALGPPDEKQRLSHAIYVRGLPWRILAIPREQGRGAERRGTGGYVGGKALGFFLQCNGANPAPGEPAPPAALGPITGPIGGGAWNCSASATLSLLAQCPAKNGEVRDHVRKIQHTFYPKENDWGYAQFMGCDQVLDPANGYIKDDTIILRVHVEADAPHGVHWDSKKHAGFIGLKNQGATCYMNSILQTLFFTNMLRKAVYMMPTTEDDSESSVALAMQRVFYELQHSDRPVGTKKLTESFGWDSLDSFLQHDVQELCRVLLDNLENKMKGTKVADTIPQLFKGRTKSFVRCTEVDFESCREETFYDVQLNVKGKNDILESFRDYTSTERLDGENKYDAGTFGMQPAEKGVRFVSFPPVLHLQLMRFQYDPQHDANVKVNDRFEFTETLNLNEFVDTPAGEDPENWEYALHAVLVHSGDFHGGHYVVFINTNLKGPARWCKFDDDVVSRASFRDAVTANYGGEDSEFPGRTFTSAYMLVYIKKTAIDDVLCPVTDEDIPQSLRQRFEQEKTEELRRKKEKSEAHLFTEVMFVTDDAMTMHHGFDLFDYRLLDDESRKEKVEKKMSHEELYQFTVNRLTLNSRNIQQIGPGDIRLWMFMESRPHNAHGLMRLRPSRCIPPLPNKDFNTMEQAHEAPDRYVFYVEMPRNGHCLEPYDQQKQMLIFLKFYDEQRRCVSYVGNLLVGYRCTLDQYLPDIRARAGLPEGTQLRFYEELSPDKIHELQGTNFVLCDDHGGLTELADGAILIFERAQQSTDAQNARAYLEYMFNQVEVDVVASNDVIPSSLSEQEQNPVQGLISLNWTVTELSEWIGTSTGSDPARILPFRMSHTGKPQSHLNDANLRTFRVKDVLSLHGSYPHDPRAHHRYRIVYTRMPVPVAELPKRQQMRIQIMDDKLNVQELTVYPEKSGTVASIIEEAKREFKFAEGGTGVLRAVFVGTSPNYMRIHSTFPLEMSVVEVHSKIATPTVYTVRVEEIPHEEMNVGSDEHLLPVAHFDKEPNRGFGVPFYFKVTDGEPLSKVSERLRQRLDVSEKEFAKYKFAMVAATRVVRYLDMNSSDKVNLAELSHTHVSGAASAPYLGIDHVNKSRGSRGSHTTEKAIVIHN